MHALPRLSALNWLRLALIPAGGDWRDLPPSVRLSPFATAEEEAVQPIALPERPGRQNGGYGVEDWTDPAHSVLGEGTVRNVRASVADPRLDIEPRNGMMGVVGHDAPAGTILAHLDVQSGRSAVADPRPAHESRAGANGVHAWDATGRTVIGHDPRGLKGAAVADPRGAPHQIGRIVQTPDGPMLVGVTLDLSSSRPLDSPPIILALDGTWHRPMTDLELAALQSLPTRLDGEWLVLTGNRGKRRELIGNAVPVATAEAIATTALGCLATSDAGSVTLSCDPVWVGPESRYATAAHAFGVHR